MRRPALLLLALLLATPLAARQQTLSKPVYLKLQQSRQLIENGDNVRAIAQLSVLAIEVEDSPYERAVVLQTLAHAHIARNDYPAAIPLLEQSLTLAVLPDQAQQRLRYNLAQLYLASGRFEDAIALLQSYLAKAGKPRAEVHALLGSAQLQLKRYRPAIASLRRAIDLSEAPRESWYQGLLGARHELKQYAESARLLRRMIALFPERPRYWRQLAGVELTRERHAEALAVMELAWRRGHLENERDRLQLARLYLQQAEPHKAARLLEDEIAAGGIAANAEHWRLSADAWYQARDMARAVAAQARALQLEPDAETGLRLARLQLESGQPQQAAQTLQELLDLPALAARQRGRIWLLLGMARYQADAPDQARAAFREAGRYPTSRKDASQWLAFLAGAD